MFKNLVSILSAALLAATTAVSAKVTVQGIERPDLPDQSIINLAPQYTNADGSFNFESITTWYGEGAKKAALVIQWNDPREENAIVFGFRWNGDIKPGKAWEAVAAADPRLIMAGETSSSYGGTIQGFGWDADGGGDFQIKNGSQIITAPANGYISMGSGDGYTAVNPEDYWQSGWFQGYWSYWVASGFSGTPGYAQTGAYYGNLEDGAFDGWNFAVNMQTTGFKPYANPPAMMPEGFPTQFYVDGVYYSLKNYTKRTAEVCSPFVIEGSTAAVAYKGEVKVPATIKAGSGELATELTVVGVADNAFAGSEVTSVSLPASVKEFGVNTFDGCKSLTSVAFAATPDKVGKYMFNGCTSLSQVPLFDNMTEIPDYYAAGTQCETLNVPATVKKIGNSSFSNCTKLKSVDLSGVTTIGKNAFENCAVTTLTLPQSLNEIKDAAFAGCDGLTDIFCKRLSPILIADKTFAQKTYETAIVHIATDYTADYKAATGWRNFVNFKESNFEFKDGDNFTRDGITYHIVSVADKTVHVTGCSLTGDVIIPARRQFQGVEFEVTEIGYYAFGYKKMTSLTISEGITKIGHRAFQNCTSLKSVILPSSLKTICGQAFKSATALTEITLPEAVTEIADSLFNGCTLLAKVNVSSGIKRIGKTAFYNCKALTDFEIPASVTEIGDAAFYYAGLTSVKIPEGIVKLNNQTFRYSSLESVTLPSTLTSIGESCFSNNSKLKEVTIPEGVTTLGSQAFYYCSSLTKVDMPKTINKLGSSLFSNCSKLENCVIPEGVTEIPSSTFNNCSVLKSVVIPSTVTTFGSSVFSGCKVLEEINIPEGVKIIPGNFATNCAALRAIVIPSTVTSIGSEAFGGCKAVTEVIIPASVTTINSYPFRNSTSLKSIEFKNKLSSIPYQFAYGCTALTTVKLPEGATQISGQAFMNCSSLASIDLPATVTKIASSAFKGCTSLADINLPAKLNSIEANAFDGCTSLKELVLPETQCTLGNNVILNSGLTKVWSRCVAPKAASASTFLIETGKYVPVQVFPGLTSVYSALTGWKTSDFSENAVKSDYAEQQPSVKDDKKTFVVRGSLDLASVAAENEPEAFSEAEAGYIAANVKVKVQYYALENDAETDLTLYDGNDGGKDPEPDYAEADATFDNGQLEGALDNLDISKKYAYRWTSAVGEKACGKSAWYTIDPSKLISGIGEINLDMVEDTINVYNVTGRCVRFNVPRSEATDGLPAGIYVADGQKIIVR